MPRPPRTEIRVQLQTRLPQQLRNRLQKEAARRGISVTMLVEKLAVAALPELEKQKL